MTDRPSFNIGALARLNAQSAPASTQDVSADINAAREAVWRTEAAQRGMMRKPVKVEPVPVPVPVKPKATPPRVLYRPLRGKR